jgi:RNA polymerase sigma-70 factor (ECF subfamily)
MTLADAFARAANVEPSQELEELLDALIEEAESTHELGPFSREEFAAYVAAHLPPGRDPLESLGEVRAGDLYLAFACSKGDARAIGVFEVAFIPEVRAAVEKVDRTFGEDALQNLRTRLLVGTEASPPKITQYAGRGDLKSWVRVAAVRDALMLLRKQKREPRAEEEALLERASPMADQEMEFLKEKYRAEFSEAFKSAIGALDKRERNLLRHHYLDELSTEEIGRIYTVHRATVTRWLARIRTTLLVRTRQHLSEKLKVDRNELESIMRLVQSRLHLSVRDLLDSQE